MANARRPLRRAPEKGQRRRVPARPRGELVDERRRHLALPSEERGEVSRRPSVRSRGRRVHVQEPSRGRLLERQEGAPPDHRLDRDPVAARRRLPAETALRVVSAAAPPRHPPARNDGAAGRHLADRNRSMEARGVAPGRSRRLREVQRRGRRGREAVPARDARRPGRDDEGPRAPERVARPLAEQPSARPPPAPRREPAPGGDDPARVHLRVPRVQLPRSRALEREGAAGAGPRARPRRDRSRPLPRTPSRRRRRSCRRATGRASRACRRSLATCRPPADSSTRRDTPTPAAEGPGSPSPTRRPRTRRRSCRRPRSRNSGGRPGSRRGSARTTSRRSTRTS